MQIPPDIDNTAIHLLSLCWQKVQVPTPSLPMPPVSQSPCTHLKCNSQYYGSQRDPELKCHPARRREHTRGICRHCPQITSVVQCGVRCLRPVMWPTTLVILGEQLSLELGWSGLEAWEGNQSDSDQLERHHSFYFHTATGWTWTLWTPGLHDVTMSSAKIPKP